MSRNSLSISICCLPRPFSSLKLVRRYRLDITTSLAPLSLSFLFSNFIIVNLQTTILFLQRLFSVLPCTDFHVRDPTIIIFTKLIVLVSNFLVRTAQNLMTLFAPSRLKETIDFMPIRKGNWLAHVALTAYKSPRIFTIQIIRNWILGFAIKLWSVVPL